MSTKGKLILSVLDHDFNYYEIVGKDCPFCGGGPGFASNGVRDMNFTYTVWFVECSICGCRTPSFGYCESEKDAKLKAIDKWNRRFTPLDNK